MNTKDILKKAITHVLTQGIQAIDLHGVCRYKITTEQGDVLKCAVGGLISDEVYSDSLEGCSIYSFMNNPPVTEQCVINAVNESLGVKLNSKVILYLRHIQDAHDHDGNDFTANFKERIESAVESKLLPEYTLEFLKESKHG